LKTAQIAKNRQAKNVSLFEEEEKYEYSLCLS